VSDEVSAPVAPVAPAPAAAPVAEAAPVSAPAESAAVPTATPEPSVDWDSWDGTIDSLPRELQQAASHIDRWHKHDYASRNSEMEDLRAVYTAMLNDEEDPRLGDLQKRLDETQESLTGRNSDYEMLQGQLDELTDLSVKDYVKQFWNTHEDLRADEARLAKFSPLLTDNNPGGASWDAYIAAKLVDLPEEAFNAAMEAKRDGVSDEYALRLAVTQAQLIVREGVEDEVKQEAAKEVRREAAKPRPAAQITNGATGATRPRVAERGMSEAKTLDDMRSLAASRALRVHKGGKR